MIRTGLLGKPWGSAAGGVPVSASAAMATTNANLCGSGHACAPWRIVAWSPDGVISAFTRVLQEPAAVKRAKARNAQRLSALPPKADMRRCWQRNSQARDHRERL